MMNETFELCYNEENQAMAVFAWVLCVVNKSRAKEKYNK